MKSQRKELILKYKYQDYINQSNFLFCTVCNSKVDGNPCQKEKCPW